MSNPPSKETLLESPIEVIQDFYQEAAAKSNKQVSLLHAVKPMGEQITYELNYS